MMTFKDLKKLVELPLYKEQRVPTVKALEVSGVPVVTEKVLENHGSINVYQNGYVIYRAHKRVTYLQPDQSLFIERAAEAYGKKGKIEAQHLAFELTELFASGDLTPQDMDGIMYEMHKAYFKYREQKREKERIMNL